MITSQAEFTVTGGGKDLLILSNHEVSALINKMGPQLTPLNDQHVIVKTWHPFTPSKESTHVALLFDGLDPTQKIAYYDVFSVPSELPKPYYNLENGPQAEIPGTFGAPSKKSSPNYLCSISFQEVVPAPIPQEKHQEPTTLEHQPSAEESGK